MGEDGSLLLERSFELAAVETALDAADAGDGTLLVFEGPAGIGKTRVLDATRQHAVERGFRVLVARGGELERDFSYGVARQLLERAVAQSPDREILLSDAAAHAAPALGLAVDESGRAAEDPSFSVRHGLYWLVANLGGPMLIAVDDVQWADAPSLRFLAHLARRLEGLQVLVAVTVRTGDPGVDAALLAELSAGPDTRRVTPAPLSPAATAELLAGITGATPDAAFGEACHAATGGNPFLVHELATALHHDGIHPVDANIPRVAELGPRTVARSIVMRLGRVSPAAVTFARVVAVLGATADPRLAATLVAMPEEQAREAINALAAAGVLTGEIPLRFSHPILREAVYRDLPPAERDALHIAAARHLRALGAPPSEVAAHLLATVPLGDARTVKALREAARSAQSQGAADLAARYLARALEEPPPAEERAALLGELGKAEWLAGEDLLGAVGHLRDALAQTTEPAERASLCAATARACFSVGDIAGAADVVERELVRPGLAREQALTLEAELGAILLLNQATPELGRRLAKFEDLPGDTTAELLVLANVACFEWLGGTADRAAALAERALGGGRAIAEVGSDSIALLETLWCIIFAERHELAARTFESAVRHARTTGSVFGLTASLTLQALDAYRRGDVVRCESEARSAIGIPGLPPFVHPPAHTYLALALIERDELEEADAVLAASWVGPYLPPLVHMNPAFYALGRLRQAQGRHEEARDAFLELGARDAQLGVQNPGVPWRIGAAAAARALGDTDDARRLTAEHLEHARRWGTPGVLGAALHADALVSSPVDIARLTEATEMLAQSPARLEYAGALVDLGVSQRVAGGRTEAQETLRAGLEEARRCGATGLVRRAHEELVVAGARPRRLQFSGLESLTAAERRICDLAASGLTNREIAQELFVTPKTVENHLGRAYMKLGIGSRDELGDALGVSPAGM